jgi:hypothetical protein
VRTTVAARAAALDRAVAPLAMAGYYAKGHADEPSLVDHYQRRCGRGAAGAALRACDSLRQDLVQRRTGATLTAGTVVAEEPTSFAAWLGRQGRGATKVTIRNELFVAVVATLLAPGDEVGEPRQVRRGASPHLDRSQPDGMIRTPFSRPIISPFLPPAPLPALQGCCGTLGFHGTRPCQSRSAAG